MLVDVIHSIFDSNDFITRDCCGSWGNWKHWYQIANIITAGAYFSITGGLIKLFKLFRNKIDKSHIKHYEWIFLLFGAFIFFCGLGHLMDFLSFYWPAYRFYTVIDVMTSIVSTVAALLLPVVLVHFGTIIKKSDGSTLGD